MKSDIFEKIQSRLEPDGEIVSETVRRIKSSGTVNKHSKKFMWIIAPSAAVFVFLIILNINSENSSRGENEIYNPVTDPVFTEAETFPETVSESMVTESKTNPVTSADEPVTDNETVNEAFVSEEWIPDHSYDNFSEYSDGLVVAPEIKANEYMYFNFNNKSYKFACECYGQIYSEVFGGWGYWSHIPNDSYIDEFLGNIDISSIYAEYGRPQECAELYSIKTLETDYLYAVKFSGESRYYLYANMSEKFENFSEFINAVNLKNFTFDGQAINRFSDGSVKIIDNDSELLNMILQLNGTITENPVESYEAETYLDAPLYGGELCFRWNSEGFVTVKAFRGMMTYDIGKEAVEGIMEYLQVS